MKKVYIIFILSFFSASVIHSQVFGEKRNHPFAGKLRLTAQIGPTFSDTDYKGWGTDVLGGTSLEYYFPSRSRHAVGFGINSDVGYISGTDNRFFPQSFRTDLYSIGAGLVYSYYLTEKLIPRFFFGISYLWYDPRDLRQNRNSINGVNSGELREFSYNAEASISYMLSEDFTLNFGFGVRVTPNDYLDGMEISYTNKDLFYIGSFGISYAFLLEPDNDSDGIADLDDFCPGTPYGAVVKEDGCIRDADSDGIADNFDQCPNTPAYVAVDNKGCPSEKENFGLIDNLNQAPNFIMSVEGKAINYSVDSDVDGVPDHRDKCENTPHDIQVDSDGCPLDRQIRGLLYQPVNSQKQETSNFIIKYNYYVEKPLTPQIYTDGKIYCIQHSSWKTYSKADEVAKLLNKKGHMAFIQETYIPEQDEFRYRVRVGYFNSYDAASEYTRWLH